MMPITSAKDISDHDNRIDDGDSQLAYKLFIELLAYQLAFPVRWIETQNYLFGRTPTVCRFVEIGPRTTLTTIAKRSARKYHAASAPSQWSNLHFLCYQEHKSKILYHSSYNEQTAPPKMEPEPCMPTHIVQNASQPATVSQSRKITVRKGQVNAWQQIDRPLLARHVVLAMTAKKLGRAFDQFSMENTIRSLAGGKSTLQNELVGDLMSEFGKLPEGVEDISLASLAEALQSTFHARIAAPMGLLISQLVSRKMPAGFNQSAIQENLTIQWGITKPHALIPLCFATTVEPPSRLPTLEAAQAYFDDVMKRYSRYEGLSLEPRATKQAIDDSLSPRPTRVDSAALEALEEKQKSLCRKFQRLLSDQLETNDRIPLAESSPATNLQQNAEMLDQWNAEFGEHFLDSIQPIFNPKHARHYNSWWNWVREDLISWVDAVSHTNPTAPIGLDPRVQNNLNRWDPTCTDIIDAQVQKLLCTEFPEQCVPDKSQVCAILTDMLDRGARAQTTDPVFVYTKNPMGPKTTVTASGRLEYSEVPRQARSYCDVVRQGRRPEKSGGPFIPFAHLKTREADTDWVYNCTGTALLHQTLQLGVTSGLNYSRKAVLVTGAGPGSIGACVVQGLLSGGARVFVTTSRPFSDSAAFFQRMYREYGARGASLTLYPMNQASKRDCDALIEYIFANPDATGGDLDFVVPFAAIPQTGEPDALDSRNELAHRAMLINVLRLVGCVRREKQKRRIDTRPTMFVLPMSCNEGTFGGDGLYAESKIGLKTTFSRFHSESWSEYITVCGAVIGWTRGTGLMRSSNMIAEDMESLGLLTFTQDEMAFNILALMSPTITRLAEDTPVFADLTGGFGQGWEIKDQIAAARARLQERMELQSALAEEDARHNAVLWGQKKQDETSEVKKCRANLKLQLPSLSSHAKLTSGLPTLQGLVDLSTIVVVVGYSELGPWGTCRTRWEMEYKGKFTLEGYVEMAWLMGLIKHVDGKLNGEPYVGWVDTETETPIRDDEVPTRYHERILSNAGLRVIKPTENDTYDPSAKEFLHEVAVEEDLPPFQSSRATAEAFKQCHGDQVKIEAIPESDDCRVFIKRGAVLMIPKTVPFHQVVAGRIPEGWDPARYGIPDDLVQQLDVISLYALCCVSEAFLSAGIKDPYELYEHIHVSELANCLGTGGGPLKAIQSIYRDRYLDRPIRGDIISEHFLNSMGAWVNMLLLSSAGPLKTPVGACATALESLDIGCEAIQSGKCKVAIVGGCDDYREEIAYEFANIKATANSAEELKQGRRPDEISRPTASSRSGFAESAGCGVQILMSAELALEMGAPIYGIVAYSQMASDQIGRSIPAPGKGVLTAAQESREAKSSPLLDLDFRRANLDLELALVKQLFGEMHTRTGNQPSLNMQLRIRDAQKRWGNNLRLQDPGIAPIKAALATWGLTVDDVGVASMHGTSTKANEINEAEVINLQMEHLGRRKGNPLLSVCQKSLTGHPKAAAGAWQLNGCLQMLQQGIVPGNRNADNIDEELRQFEHLVYPVESMRKSCIKATMLTSFGFGQKGAINLMVAPRYLFASLSAESFERYRARAIERSKQINPVFVRRMIKNCIVQVKNQPPWKDATSMQSVLLDPRNRLNPDGSKAVSESTPSTTDDLALRGRSPTHPFARGAISQAVQQALDRIAPKANGTLSVHMGVDIEEVCNIDVDNAVFVERNFTLLEREHCWGTANPQASFAGRWSAKEAVFKSLRTPSSGPGAAMHEIEIASDGGIPQVTLHGNARAVADAKGIHDIEVTISHCDGTAIAIALAGSGHPQSQDT